MGQNEGAIDSYTRQCSFCLAQIKHDSNPVGGNDWRCQIDRFKGNLKQVATGLSRMSSRTCGMYMMVVMYGATNTRLISYPTSIYNLVLTEIV